MMTQVATAGVCQVGGWDPPARGGPVYRKESSSSLVSSDIDVFSAEVAMDEGRRHALAALLQLRPARFQGVALGDNSLQHRYVIGIQGRIVQVSQDGAACGPQDLKVVVWTAVGKTSCCR